MTRDQIVAHMDRRGQAFANADAEALSKAYALDGVLESPVSGVAEGRDAIRSAYDRLFAALGPLDHSREELLVDGNRAVQCFIAKGKHSGEFFGLPATGKAFTIRGVTVLTFEGDEIAHERRVHDFTGLLVNLGVLKEKSS